LLLFLLSYTEIYFLQISATLQKINDLRILTDWKRERAGKRKRKEKKGKGKEKGKTFYCKSLFSKNLPNTFTVMLPGFHLSVTLPRFRNRVIFGGFSAPGCRMLLKFKK
jgi:hypothetical protein